MTVKSLQVLLRPGGGYSVQQRTELRQTGPLDKQTLKTTTSEILSLWELWKNKIWESFFQIRMVSEVVQLLMPKAENAQNVMWIFFDTQKWLSEKNKNCHRKHFQFKALQLQFPLRFLAQNLSFYKFSRPQASQFGGKYIICKCIYYIQKHICLCMYFIQFRLHSTSQAASRILNILLNAIN